MTAPQSITIPISPEMRALIVLQSLQGSYDALIGFMDEAEGSEFEMYVEYEGGMEQFAVEGKELAENLAEKFEWLRKVAKGE